MKKFVILMLALMLALTSVSAMAADQSCSGAGTLDVTLEYVLPESFEWTAPDKVTLNDDIFDSAMENVIKVTLTKANLIPRNCVRFSIPSTLTMVNGGASFDLIIANSFFLIQQSGATSYFSEFCTAESKDSLTPGTYTGSVTITATISEY